MKKIKNLSLFSHLCCDYDSHLGGRFFTSANIRKNFLPMTSLGWKYSNSVVSGCAVFHCFDFEMLQRWHTSTATSSYFFGTWSWPLTTWWIKFSSSEGYFEDKSRCLTYHTRQNYFATQKFFLYDSRPPCYYAATTATLQLKWTIAKSLLIS